MRHRFFFCFTFALLPLWGWAQKLITARVVDSATGTPLPYCHILLSSNTEGTVTNANGYFRLLSSSNNDSLVLTHMGYKTKSIRITDLADSTLIYLCSQSTWLNEVEVSSITARQVVEKAIASIQENYFISPYITRNFYRVTSTINEQYAHLSEAVFDIYHVSSKNNKHQLKLIKSRGTQNKAVTMGFYLGLSPQRVFQIDVIQQHKYYEWLSPEGLDNYIYRLAPSPDVNGKSTYKVEFDQIEGSFSGYKGYMIMDRQNFAIVHIDFNLSPKGLRHHQYGNNEYRARMAAGHTRVRTLQNRLQVWYKPVEGKY